MSWETIHEAIQQWAETFAPTMTAVIFRDQDAPQPERPYIDLGFNIITKPGDDFETAPGQDGSRTIYGTREFTTSIRLHGVTNAQGDLDTLLQTLSRRDVRDGLRSNGVIIVRTGSALDTTALEGSKNISRSDAEIFCRTSIDVSYGGDTPGTQIIEHVTVTGKHEPTLQHDNREQTMSIPS